MLDDRRRRDRSDATASRDIAKGNLRALSLSVQCSLKKAIRHALLVRIEKRTAMRADEIAAPMPHRAFHDEIDGREVASLVDREYRIRRVLQEASVPLAHRLTASVEGAPASLRMYRWSGSGQSRLATSRRAARGCTRTEYGVVPSSSPSA